MRAGDSAPSPGAGMTRGLAGGAVLDLSRGSWFERPLASPQRPKQSWGPALSHMAFSRPFTSFSFKSPLVKLFVV